MGNPNEAFGVDCICYCGRSGDTRMDCVWCVNRLGCGTGDTVGDMVHSEHVKAIKAIKYNTSRHLVALFHQLELVEDEINGGATYSYSNKSLAWERSYILEQILLEQLRIFNYE